MREIKIITVSFVVLSLFFLTGAGIGKKNVDSGKCDIPALLRKYAGRPIGDVEIKNGDALCLAHEAFKKAGWLDTDGDFKERKPKAK